MTETIDQTRPADGAKWRFDADVTRVFDNMLQRSVPGHDAMRQLVFELGRRFVRADTHVVDAGCSRGAALMPFTAAFGTNILCVGLDESPAMLEAARERFSGHIAAGLCDFRQHDLRNGLPADVRPSVTLAVLTLQFVPIEYRQKVVADVYRKTIPGGAFIVVEKVLGPDAAADRLLVDTYYLGKAANGYTPEQIEAKRRSLEGVLVPLTTAGNVAMLEAEGFRVTQFWQHLNFVGWLAVKPKGRR